jgi:hypothetical protein
LKTNGCDASAASAAPAAFEEPGEHDTVLFDYARLTSLTGQDHAALPIDGQISKPAFSP